MKYCIYRNIHFHYLRHAKTALNGVGPWTEKYDEILKTNLFISRLQLKNAKNMHEPGAKIKLVKDI